MMLFCFFRLGNPPKPIAIQPATISATPAVITILLYHGSNLIAANANGTVNPSLMPITISEINSDFFLNDSSIM